MNQPIKICKHCGKTSDKAKWADMRGPNGTAKGKVCRSCTNGNQKDINSTEAGRAKIKSKNARRYADPEIRLRIQAHISDVRSTEEGRQKIRTANINNRDKRRATDLQYQVSDRIRATVASSFKRLGYNKASRSHEILGATFEVVAAHLKIADGIPEGYVIDHIIPMAVAYDEASAIRLNHYTNLQLLTEADNLAKSDWYTFPSGECIRARDMTLEQKKTIIEGIHHE
jgi:hypothetical protein